MILVLQVILLCEYDKPGELLEPLRNPATSSYDMVLDDLIIHIR